MGEKEHEREPDLTTDQPAQQAAAAGQSATVLVVDDEGAIIPAIRGLREEEGYQVLAARHGEEAMETFQAHHEEIDLVILDLVMPRMGGERCLEELLEIDPQARVVMTTGFQIDDATYNKLAAKAKEFLPKPIAPIVLLKTVTRALSKD